MVLETAVSHVSFWPLHATLKMPTIFKHTWTKLCDELNWVADGFACSIVFTKQVKVCLPCLPVSWYRITLGVKGEAKGYNCETWHWSQHLRASNSPFPTVSIFLIFVTQPAALIAFESKTSRLMYIFCVIKEQSKGTKCSFSFFLFPYVGPEASLKKQRCCRSLFALHIINQTELTFFLSFFLRRMNIHPLSVEGPWYLYGQCDLSPYPLRLGVRHRKLRSCSGP